jgi:hypothetical protein
MKGVFSLSSLFLNVFFNHGLISSVLVKTTATERKRAAARDLRYIIIRTDVPARRGGR